MEGTATMRVSVASEPIARTTWVLPVFVAELMA
jgi:hypothetical protein